VRRFIFETGAVFSPPLFCFFFGKVGAIQEGDPRPFPFSPPLSWQEGRGSSGARLFLPFSPSPDGTDKNLIFFFGPGREPGFLFSFSFRAGMGDRPFLFFLGRYPVNAGAGENLLSFPPFPRKYNGTRDDDFVPFPFFNRKRGKQRRRSFLSLFFPFHGARKRPDRLYPFRRGRERTWIVSLFFFFPSFQTRSRDVRPSWFPPLFLERRRQVARRSFLALFLFLLREAVRRRAAGEEAWLFFSSFFSCAGVTRRHP